MLFLPAKRHTVIRCPLKLLASINKVCQENRLTRTRLINMALFTYAAQNGGKGLLPPFDVGQLPPPNGV